MAQAHADEQVGMIDRGAEQSGSAAELVERHLDLGREGVVASDFS
ncbi:hypothetical protein OG205_01450 [Lentzea sp. NBC_00516]|nr:hypothetical protein [Lentzea sp. NBC_00516]WUD25691.1 hypothetical protein OG205_01450 [Lentzea sp. NBC_00516]